MTRSGERRKIKRPPGFVLKVNGVPLRRMDLSFANLERANLAQADASDSILRGANFKDAILTGTILKGADLRDAENLTAEQLADAIIDDRTLLPHYLSREDLLRHRTAGTA